MKQILSLLTLLSFILGYSQSKKAIVNFNNVTANITLDNDVSLATLTLTGPNDRWFALQFGSFDNGMQAGSDVVYWNNVTLVDAVLEGIGVAPTIDDSNNWTVVSNDDNMPVAGLRTLVYSRPFDTGGGQDFTFNYADTTLDFTIAHASTSVFGLDYHRTNRDRFLDVPLTVVVLGIEDITKDKILISIYPNPTKDYFSIQSKEKITKILIYDITGKQVKSFTSSAEPYNISSLQKGVYFVEISKENGEAQFEKLIKN